MDYKSKHNTEKKELRKNLQKQRQQLSVDHIQDSSATIANKVFALKEYKHAKIIALYFCDNGEVDPKLIFLNAEQQQKDCYFPVLHQTKSGFLQFYTHQSDQPLATNHYGIAEPVTSQQQYIEPQHIDVVFFPLVGFDAKGNRLGRGAGYYDRTFAFRNNSTQCKKPLIIGLGHEFQKLDDIPAAAWDVSLDIVITEENIYFR